MQWLTNFHLDEGGLIWQGPRKHARVTEAGPQQHGYDEEEEHGSKHWDGRREVHSQKGASAKEPQKKQEKWKRRRSRVKGGGGKKNTLVLNNMFGQQFRQVEHFVVLLFPVNSWSAQPNILWGSKHLTLDFLDWKKLLYFVLVIFFKCTITRILIRFLFT